MLIGGAKDSQIESSVERSQHPRILVLDNISLQLQMYFPNLRVDPKESFGGKQHIFSWKAFLYELVQRPNQMDEMQWDAFCLGLLGFS